MTNPPSRPPSQSPSLLDDGRGASKAQLPEGAPAETAAVTTHFEGSMKRLAEIVSTLERGELPLEDTISLFEEGVRLASTAQGRLDAAQKRVEELLSVDESGRARTAPFSLREE